ncbi:MAG TPA: isocitrate lyase/phosphoenolpyruvate mutase family protein [Terriglobia bacterium]|nr:isocitrate lyase/phosphoenolpyruvate mutase family protein [Terriglobia bacterium]
MSNATLAAKAEQFLKLHHGPQILVLANVWDVASARIVEHAGFKAIATSSAAVANSLGYPDGQRISRADMLDVVRRIAAKVSVPVSADLEAGYGESPEAMAETARALIEAGAVGLNLEDGVDETALIPVRQHVEKVKRIREEGERLGVHVVINARTDVYLAGIGEASARFDDTIERLAAYRNAGADSLFVPGVYDAETIGRLAKTLPAPLNVLANPKSPSISELERLGVRRLSFGSWPARAALGFFARFTREVIEQRTFSTLGDWAIPYAEINRLVS